MKKAPSPSGVPGRIVNEPTTSTWAAVPSPLLASGGGGQRSVLLASSDPLTRAGVGALFTGAGFSVLEASSGDEFESCLACAPADVALVDLALTGSVGETIELVRGFCAAYPDLAVLVLVSSEVRDADRIQVLEAGAVGLLDRSDDDLDAVAALRASGAGLAVFSRKALASVLRSARSVYPPAACGDVGDAISTLTRREFEVLALVAAGHQNGDIAEQLVVSEATVKSHVSSVLAKLGVPTRAQAVVAAYEAGVVQPSSRNAHA